MTRTGSPVRVFRYGGLPQTSRPRLSYSGIEVPDRSFHRTRAIVDELVNGRQSGRIVYVVLLALLVGSVWAAVDANASRVVDLFASNLATEVLGLIVTLVIVQRFLERQERALRLRGSLGALRKSGRALSAMATAWSELVKGAVERAPDPRPTSLYEVLAPDLTSALAHASASHATVVAASQRLKAARETLRAVVSTYGANLDPIYLGAIDDLADDAFLALVTDEDGMHAPAWAHGGVRSARASHFERLLLAIDCHNQLARDAARLRDRRTAPRGDGYGPSLPLDADLRVGVTVAAEWWSVEPRPGALRTVRFRDADIPKADGPRVSADRAHQANALKDNELIAIAATA